MARLWPIEAGKADRAEIAQRHPEAAAEHAEDGVLGGHPEVAPQGELQAAGHRVTPRRPPPPAWRG